MKIVAFAGSNSRESINKQLVTDAARRFAAKRQGAETEILDLNDYPLPIYSKDLEDAEGIPPNARAFYDKIGSADALLVSYAVHNGGYAAVFKNLFDWMSRIDQKVFQGKPMAMMAASPGASGGAVLLDAAKVSAPYFGAEVVDAVPVGKFGEVFDVAAGTVTDPEVAAKLDAAVAKLAAALTESAASA